jgi:hypothetical protein
MIRHSPSYRTVRLQLSLDTTSAMMPHGPPYAFVSLKTKLKNLSTLVLMLNQKTHAPRLYVHDTERARRHLTSRSFDHRVLDLWLIIPDPL